MNGSHLFRGVVDKDSQIWWNLHLPLKIKVFMWMVFKQRITTRDQMIKRGWPGNPQCSFCSLPESVEHIFLHCQFVKFLWFWMGDCQLLYPHWSNMNDLLCFANCLPKNEKEAFLIVISALFWALWKIRNDIYYF